MIEGSITDSGATLERISRHENSRSNEKWSIASAGSFSPPLAVKVISNVSYNVYKVRAVQIGSAGADPVFVSLETEATNLAENFHSSGQLPTGSYAIMIRTGGKNVFYAKA